MLSILILARGYRVSWLALAVVVSVSVAACESVPLLAPTGSTITLTSSATALSANGSTQIIAQVLEAAGTPPHSGTHVTFTTTLGRIEPAEISTDANGRAIVTFFAGGANGTATITAISGGATTGSDHSVRIAVGSAAIGQVILSANPTTVPASGGSSTLTATALDINGNALTATPVSFSATAGSLSSVLVLTNDAGNAVTTLTTSLQSVVTASVGVSGTSSTGTTGTGTTGTTGTGTTTPTSTRQSASVTIGISNGPTVAIKAPDGAISRNLPASFTFTVTPATTNGSAIRDLIIDWGDGDVRNLGSVTGAQNATHVYRQEGTFYVTATVTDAAGNRNTVSTSVFVGPLARPALSVTFSPATVTANTTQVTFTITVGNLVSGLGILSGSIDYGDGTVESIAVGGGGSTTARHIYTAAGSKIVSVTITDTTNRDTSVSTTVVVNP